MGSRLFPGVARRVPGGLAATSAAVCRRNRCRGVPLSTGNSTGRGGHPGFRSHQRSYFPVALASVTTL